MLALAQSRDRADPKPSLPLPGGTGRGTQLLLLLLLSKTSVRRLEELLAALGLLWEQMVDAGLEQLQQSLFCEDVSKDVEEPDSPNIPTRLQEELPALSSCFTSTLQLHHLTIGCSSGWKRPQRRRSAAGPSRPPPRGSPGSRSLIG